MFWKILQNALTSGNYPQLQQYSMRMFTKNYICKEVLRNCGAMLQKSGNFTKICEMIRKAANVEFGAVQKYANRIDLEKYSNKIV